MPVMQMFLRLKTFITKKGMRPPITDTPMAARTKSCEVKVSHDKKASTTIHRPEDRPSMPSIILMALMIPTQATTVSGHAIKGDISWIPHKP